MKEEKFEEASLGIFAYDKNIIPYLEDSLDITKGIYVAQISLDSPANTTLRIGDIITKIDDLELTKMCDLRSYIYTKKPGDEVVLNVLRNNKEQQISIILGTKWEMETFRWEKSLFSTKLLTKNIEISKNDKKVLTNKK